MHPADLLVNLGLVDLDKKEAYPSRLFFSKEDYKELENNLKKSIKRTDGWTAKAVNYSVGIDMLNYGPNQSLEEVIRPGWALISD